MSRHRILAGEAIKFLCSMGPTHYYPVVQLPLTELGPTANSDGPTEEERIPHWAVPQLIFALTLAEAAANASDPAAARQIVANGEATISQFFDDYCGTPPRLGHWIFPGPAPWISAIASELVLAANSLQEGSLRTSLLRLSGRLLEKIALNPQPLPP